MSRLRNKPAMLAGIALVALFLTSQLLSTGLFSVDPISREGRGATFPGTISSSAANEVVQLAGADQVVRYVARNASAVSVPNTAASNNVTLPATTAPASVLDSTNMSLKLGTATYNSTHVIEDDSGFDFPITRSPATGWYNTSAARMPFALKNGTSVTSPLKLNKDNDAVWWIINSGNKFVQFDLEYNFTSTTVDYNNVTRIDLWLKMKFNQSVLMDVYVYDHRNNQGWVKATDEQVLYQGGVTEPEINVTVKLEDTHSQSMRYPNRCLNVSFRFFCGEHFKASFDTAKLRLQHSREIPVNGNNWVGLSFDLRGTARVHGFSMYLRSLAVASTELLSLQVYKSTNSSITQLGIWANGAGTFYQEPDIAQPVAGTYVQLNHTGDGVNWFNFTSPVLMATGHYFVVLSSNVAAGTRFRLAVLPHNGPITMRDPDLKDDHTVAVSANSGSTWAEAVVPVSLYELDAAPFAVGLRRGLVPSEIDLKINATKVADWKMSNSTAYSSTNYEWGRGDWSQVNVNARTTTSTFELPITWNKTIHPTQTDFMYNATASMLVYAEDPGASLLKLSRDEPLWKVSYQFNRTKYASWSGLYFNFTFPSDWSVINVTYPDNVDYYNSTYRTSISNSRSMYPVDYKSINGLDPGIQQSTYTSWFNSPNYTKQVDTFLRFNPTTFHESAHFVNGDSMSARVSVQTGSGRAVLNGQVNLTLFYPNESQAATMTSSVINSTAGFVTRYHFGDASLHTFAGTAVGRHLARAFWFNGSEAGIFYHDVFKVNYTVIGYQVDELLDEGSNHVSGSFLTGANESIPTNLVYVSIDKDDVVPVGIAVNQSIGDVTFMEFNQTQTVFNPSENINFTIKLKSTSLGLPHQVWANVQVVQAFHPDRIVMNLSTSPVVLNYTGGADSERALNLTGTFPALGGSGINAPLRHSLFETRVKLYVDGYVATTWTSNETYAVRMANSTDGTVLAVKVIRDYTGTSFSQLFTRANETVYNQVTTFMMLLESSGGVTLPDVLARDFTNSMTSVIEEMAAEPVAGDVLTANNSVVLSGRLFLEDGRTVNDTAVQVSRHNGTSWVPYFVAGSTTNNSLPASNGTFSGTFKLPSAYNRTMTVRFFWAGNLSVANTSSTLVINITEYAPGYTITAQATTIVVVGGSYRNSYTFIVQNTGNTTLMFEDFIHVESSDITAEVASWINVGLLDIEPGSEFSFSLILTAENPGTGQGFSANFTIELHAFSIETKEDMIIVQPFTASVQPPDLGSQLASVWYLGYFAAIALLVILALFLLKRVSAQAKRPAGVGTLTKGKAAPKAAELPYEVKKGADIAKPEGEKKYKSIDEAMAEVKGKDAKDGEAGGEGSSEDEAGEPAAGGAEPGDESDEGEE
ncbi:MAG: hypothetical protein JW839_18565 [Candidatus Lokiarchaeota archaeon]|nr:hypothetical protein [Candidatus Lokiarchaeota archaeon]